MSKRTCCSWAYVFSGTTVAAVPNQELVTVAIGDSEDGKDYWLCRDTIQAWGAYTQRLMSRDNYRLITECPRCGEEDDRVGCGELRPLVVGEDGNLYAGGWDECNEPASNMGIVGVYAAGKEPDEQAIARALEETRRKMASDEKRRTQTKTSVAS